MLLRRISLLFLLCIFVASDGAAVDYDFIDLGAGFEPHGINNQGQIVGTFKSSKPFLSDYEEAAIWDRGHGLEIIKSDEGDLTSAHGMNDLGQIVGRAYRLPSFCNVCHTVLWDSKKRNWTYFGYSDTNSTLATAINNSSMVCGYAVPHHCKNPHAFVWHGNTQTRDLHPSTLEKGKAYFMGMSKAYDINDNGQIVGEYSDENDIPNAKKYAFKWTPIEGFQKLDIPGDFSKAYGNNQKGDIVGSFKSENGLENAFLYKASGAFQNLGGEGVTGAVAYAINNQNEIVGSGKFIEKFQQRKSAFIWKTGKIKSLNKLIDSKVKWWLVEASDINERGEIVGVAVNENDKSIKHGFLLMPRPKPLLQVDEDKGYKCIFLSLEDQLNTPFPERKFVIIPGKTINELNESGKAWCQPLELVDLDREGASKYQHDKQYEVILMYVSGQTAKTFVSYDSLCRNRKKTELENAHSGDVFLVPGYFLNDWNNRVNPVTGEVYYWFQPTEVLSQSTKRNMIDYAKSHKF